MNRLPLDRPSPVNGNGHAVGAIHLGAHLLQNRIGEVLEARWKEGIEDEEEPKAYTHVFTFQHRGSISEEDVEKLRQALVNGYHALVRELLVRGVKVDRKDVRLVTMDTGQMPDGTPACRFGLEWKKPEVL